MGWGDDIITTGMVKRAYAKVQKPLVVGDDGWPQWSAVFENNPKIAKKAYPGCFWVRTGKGNRPYIDYEKSTDKRTVYKRWEKEPGEVFLSETEKAKYAVEGVYIEPNVKGSYGGNKDWGFERWQQVVDALPEIPWIQGAGRALRGVRQIETLTFRDALSVLYHCDLIVGTDGGMHHAAAAMSKPAVVVWGGLVGPDILGYDFHTNLHSGTHSCGSHESCKHCRDALNRISVGQVVDAVRQAYRVGQAEAA